MRTVVAARPAPSQSVAEAIALWNDGRVIIARVDNAVLRVLVLGSMTVEEPGPAFWGDCFDYGQGVEKQFTPEDLVREAIDDGFDVLTFETFTEFAKYVLDNNLTFKA